LEALEEIEAIAVMEELDEKSPIQPYVK